MCLFIFVKYALPNIYIYLSELLVSASDMLVLEDRTNTFRFSILAAILYGL